MRRFNPQNCPFKAKQATNGYRPPTEFSVYRSSSAITGNKWLSAVFAVNFTPVNFREKEFLFIFFWYKITFYVANLPTDCTTKELQQEFSRFGKVLDVYIAGKKDKSHCHFGFVRFPEVGNPVQLERDLNNIKLKNLKISVNIAKYEKDGKAQRFHSVQNHRKAYRSDNLEKTASHTSSWRIVVPDNFLSKTELNWGATSLLGRATDLRVLCSLRELILDQDNLTIRHLGGLNVLLTFSNIKNSEVFLSNTHMWKPWFTSLEKWVGNLIRPERIAWLRIHGVPVQLWEANIFNKVASAFGRVVHPSEACLLDLNLTQDYVAVLTSSLEPINGGISLE
ncbi:hypothetical protein E3N88_26591 [Mikania micrantha]|uniref:RRM domain-containing protein n=1 Tax=Mikania micrantha TaxID=192012 RepID=A0A5N6MVC8_9ASTR|nr:hypothetical protein E3N88_26591 [Mikania micrantha]